MGLDAALEALSWSGNLARLDAIKLTRRELHVLRLMAEGLTNGEIAVGLGLSLRTVRTHQTAIFNKFDMSDRAGVVAIGYRVGLLP